MIRQVMTLNHPPLRADGTAQYLANQSPFLAYKKQCCFVLFSWKCKNEHGLVLIGPTGSVIIAIPFISS